MTGADCPGKSATQSASCIETFSGKPVSRETPHCSGPRQLSQPRRASPASAQTLDPERMAPIVAAKTAARKYTFRFGGIVKLPRLRLYSPSKATTEDEATFHDVQLFCKWRLLMKAEM